MWSQAVRQDFFGELGLLQTKQQLYSARAMTHVDAYRLDRADFEATMREHPAEAVQVRHPTITSVPRDPLQRAPRP